MELSQLFGLFGLLGLMALIIVQRIENTRLRRALELERTFSNSLIKMKIHPAVRKDVDRKVYGGSAPSFEGLAKIIQSDIVPKDTVYFMNGRTAEMIKALENDPGSFVRQIREEDGQ